MRLTTETSAMDINSIQIEFDLKFMDGVVKFSREFYLFKAIAFISSKCMKLTLKLQIYLLLISIDIFCVFYDWISSRLDIKYDKKKLPCDMFQIFGFELRFNFFTQYLITKLCVHGAMCFELKTKCYFLIKLSN